MANNAVNLQSIVTRSDERLLGSASQQPARRPERGEQQEKKESKNPPPASVEAPKVKIESTAAAVTFEVDSSSGETFIQVIDRDTGEVVKQIPPEEFRKMAEALKKVTGQVIDKLA